jgi:hypothetical protein
VRRVDRYEQQQRNRVALGTIIIVVLLSGVAFIFFQKKEVEKVAAAIDRMSFCPLKEIESVTAIVIDNTDVLSPIQKRSLETQLRAVVEKVPRHGKLELYAIESTKAGTVAPRFSMCSPGRKEEVSEWTENPERTAKQWREKFQEPALSTISGLLQSPKRDSSPIMETIQSVSLTSLSDLAVSHRAQRSLIVASDMLEFGADLNMYKGVPNAEEFMRSDAFRKLKGNLRGVEVSILLFRRASAAHIQNDNFIQFWGTFFDKQGVVDVVTSPVVG